MKYIYYFFILLFKSVISGRDVTSRLTPLFYIMFLSSKDFVLNVQFLIS